MTEAPAAPPGEGAASDVDRVARWLLPAGPLLVYAQLALLDYDANWGRNRLSGWAGLLVAVVAVTILGTIAIRNWPPWRSAAVAVAPAVLLVLAARILLLYGGSLSAGQAVVFLLGVAVGVTMLAWAFVRPAPRPAVAAAATWLAAPPMLLLIA